MTRDAASKRTTVFGLVIMLTIIGLMLVIVAGCGGDGVAEATTTTAAAPAATTSTAATPTTAAAPETTASTAVASEPAGEVGGTASVSSTNGGYPTENIPDWSQIKSAVAYRDASMGVASLFVSLATYEVTAASISEYRALPSPEAGQGRIELILTRTVSGVNEPPSVTGTYDFNVPQGQTELTGAGAIILPGGTQVTFVVGALESAVQITAISDTQVTGTFSVKDKWTEISGTFTAPIK